MVNCCACLCCYISCEYSANARKVARAHEKERKSLVKKKQTKTHARAHTPQLISNIRRGGEEVRGGGDRRNVGGTEGMTGMSVHKKESGRVWSKQGVRETTGCHINHNMEEYTETDVNPRQKI